MFNNYKTKVIISGCQRNLINLNPGIYLPGLEPPSYMLRLSLIYVVVCQMQWPIYQ